MWLKIILIFCYLSSNFFCYSQNEKHGVIWDESFKLSWNDFKAQPDVNTDVVAVTASGITFQYAIKKSDNQIVGFTSKVVTVFYPEKSWY